MQESYETSEIDTILSTGQFQVKTWHSNNKNVNQSDEERPDFLGHKWIKVLDKISFKKSEIVADLTNLSKRGCLICHTNVGSHGARSTMHH